MSLLTESGRGHLKVWDPWFGKCSSLVFRFPWLFPPPKRESLPILKWSEVTQSCLILWDPMDYSPQAPRSTGFSRHEYWSGLLFPSPGESSRPRARTRVSRIVGRCFTVWATREAHLPILTLYNPESNPVSIELLLHSPGWPSLVAVFLLTL